MSVAAERRGRVGVDDTITKADILGTERRTRRGMTPVPAGGSVKEDGSVDYGIFGPGSMVWQVLLHPALITFHHAGQQQAQAAYKPIEAGIRDWEPLSKKGQAGQLTMFDTFERASRGAGMHLPMWLGDTATAEHMAAWLHKVHGKVKGDVIDVARPELGGYDAAGPRESLWAVLTEMHPMLRMYESFAFRDGKAPHPLTPAERNQFVAEVAAYCRLHGAAEEDIPHSVADLQRVYDKYAPLFEPSETIHTLPSTGEDYSQLMQDSIRKNFKLSHLRAVRPMLLVYVLLAPAVSGALPSKVREGLGFSAGKSRRALAARKLVLPFAWLLQRPFFEKRLMRTMWGADGVMLIQSARELNRKMLAERASS